MKHLLRLQTQRRSVIIHPQEECSVLKAGVVNIGEANKSKLDVLNYPQKKQPNNDLFYHNSLNPVK